MNELPITEKPSSCGCGCGHESLPELDARVIPHAIRHASILGVVEHLNVGGAFILVPPQPAALLAQIADLYGDAIAVSYVGGRTRGLEVEARTPQLTSLNDKAASAPVSRRVFLVMLAGISLVTGLNAGLVRLGVWAPVVNGRLADLHGPLMVLGFMGSLISLERAQALRNRLAYAAPILLGAGAVVLISGLFPVLGRLLLFDGTLAFVAVMVALYRRAPLPLVAAQVVGAVLACLAAALLVVVEIAALVPLLAGFIVVTIAAERRGAGPADDGAPCRPNPGGSQRLAFPSSGVRVAVAWDRRPALRCWGTVRGALAAA